MMFSIETLAGCVTLDLTTKSLVVRSKVALLRRDDDAHNMCASSSRRVLRQTLDSGAPILSRYREVHWGISRVRS